MFNEVSSSHYFVRGFASSKMMQDTDYRNWETTAHRLNSATNIGELLNLYIQRYFIFNLLLHEARIVHIFHADKEKTKDIYQPSILENRVTITGHKENKPLVQPKPLLTMVLFQHERTFLSTHL